MTNFLQEYPHGIILALDQMRLYFQATLSCVWSPVGQTPSVSVHPQRESMYFYGALNLRDGREVALPTTEANTEITTNFVMQFLMLYPQPILLLLDCAPQHFGELTALIDQTDRLQVPYFPPACPEINPREHVWERARDAISHTHTHRQFQILIEDFEVYPNDTLFSTNFHQLYGRLYSSPFRRSLIHLSIRCRVHPVQ